MRSENPSRDLRATCERMGPAILVAVALALFAWQLWRFGFVVDDAYISFRYARNFAQGEGLVFNPDEAPVEGYTNFLWTVFLSSGEFLGIPIVLWAQAAGVLFSLWAVYSAGLLLSLLLADVFCIDRITSARDCHCLRGWMVAAGVALTLTNASWILWAGAGLEGPLFAALLTSGTLFFLRFHVRPNWATLGAAALSFSLLILCRPEGIALAAVCALFFFFQPVRHGSYWPMRMAPALCFALVYTGHLLWRYHYYGDLLPNTFYAKVGFNLEQLKRGLFYLWQYSRDFGGILWLVFLFLAWRALRGLPGRSFLFGAPIVYLLMVIVVGGDALPIYRFIAPVVPLLAILCTAGLAFLIRAVRELVLARNEETYFVRFFASAIILILLAHGYLPAHFGHQAEYIKVDRERMGDRVAIGRWLEGRFPEGTIALNAAGAIPYYSGMKAIDMLGLTDRHIARTELKSLGAGVAGHEKFDSKYVLTRRPEIVFIGRNELTLEPRGVFVWLEGDRRLLNDPRLEANYRVETVQIGYEYFSFFLRRDIALP